MSHKILVAHNYFIGLHDLMIMYIYVSSRLFYELVNCVSDKVNSYGVHCYLYEVERIVYASLRSDLPILPEDPTELEDTCSGKTYITLYIHIYKTK